MQEQNTSSMFTMFGEMIALLGVLALIFLGFQLSQINTYKQQINYTIERQGGLTTEALADLKKTSNEQYAGYFTIVAATYDANNDGIVDQGEGLVGNTNGTTWMSAMPQGDFGQMFKYQLHIKIPIPFGGVLASSESSPLKYLEADMVGSSVSKVRR